MHDKTIHIRAFDGPPEMRSDRRLVFYPAVFNSKAKVTEYGETFFEVIRPGAFARSLASNRDVIATIEHAPESQFAARSTGLILQEDARGLFASVYLGPSPANDRIIADVKSGKLNGGSVFFRDRPGGRTRTADTPYPLDEVNDADLIDVCLSAGSQVYKDTTVSVRTDALGALLALRLRRLKLKLAR